MIKWQTKSKRKFQNPTSPASSALNAIQGWRTMPTGIHAAGAAIPNLSKRNEG
jgi:hypothetical protein